MATPATPMSFRFTGDWKKYGRKLEGPRFRRALDKTLPQSLEKSALQMVKLIRATMTRNKVTKNAVLTIAIKGSTKPLVDYGDLFAAITHQMVEKNAVFVGVLQQALARDGSSLSNMAKNLHNGIKIPVTPRMRRMFYYLALASQGAIDPGELTGRAKVLFSRYKNWKPLNEKTTHITIPGRPWISIAFANKAFRDKFKIELENAVIRAIKMVR